VRTDYYFGSPVVTVAWIVAVAVVISGGAVAISHRRGADRAAIVERLEVVWLIAAVGAVALLTLQPGPGGLGSALPQNVSPVSNPSLSDALANVVLYLPVGFFATLVWRRRARPVAWATGLAFSVSLSIEAAQWLLPIGRASETRDVIFNTLGGLIGAVAGTLVARHGHRSDVPTSGDGSGPGCFGQQRAS
jgi:VanZ family protein